jgi:hypothetical protein
VHDLAIAKYVAGREKDLSFTRSLVRHSMVSRELLDRRLGDTRIDSTLRAVVTTRIQRDFSDAAR